jgi:hypothetical protein
MLIARPLHAILGVAGKDDSSITLRPNSLQANRPSADCARDRLPSEYQRSFQNGKGDNALDHNQAPSVSETDLPETRRRNQSGYQANVLSGDATDALVWYAPILNDISS